MSAPVAEWRNYDLAHRIARNIRRALKTRGLLQNQLAVAVGLGTNELSQYMTTERPIDLELLFDIADVLNVDIRELLDEDPSR